MKIEAHSIEEYLSLVPEERKESFDKLRKIIKDNIPEGFQEMMNYDTIGYVVPHSRYPAGYHCEPSLPLPFLNIGSQKNFIALYHLGIYSDPDLLEWFTTEYKKVSKHKLDMGKSCVRFKYMDDIPFELIGELIRKITVDQWVNTYEKAMKPKK